jgi:prefoldin subunit 5
MPTHRETLLRQTVEVCCSREQRTTRQIEQLKSRIDALESQIRTLTETTLSQAMVIHSLLNMEKASLQKEDRQ